MTRSVVLAGVVLLVLLGGPAAAAPARTVPLEIGDAVEVAGTKIACFAITSNGKNGIACVLWRKDAPVVGSFGTGLAADGTAVLNRIKADGTSQQIFKRRPHAAGRPARVYRLGVGDVFGFPVTKTLSLGCRILRVTDTRLAEIYRGVKVLCYRATAAAPLASTFGVAISDRVAGVYRYDARGEVGKDVAVRRQPR